MSPRPYFGSSRHEPSPSFRRTLYIGLGGTGVKVLTLIKRLYIEHHGQVPVCTRFLALDTDANLPRVESPGREQGVQLEPVSEFHHLRLPSFPDYIENSDARDWLIEPLPTQAIPGPPGAVRQVGRLVLMAHAHRVGPQIRESFAQLQDLRLPVLMKAQGFTLVEEGWAKPEIDVYICSSLAGGTGSGMFLDLGIFCRSVLPAESLICAALVGPWIHRNVGVTFRTPANAYAALMELDLLTTIGLARHRSGGEPQEYKVRYDRDPITMECPPFDVVHYLDGINQDGMAVRQTNELYGMIAEGLFLESQSWVNSTLAAATARMSCGIAIGSPEVWNGKHALYSSFGVAAAVYPAANYVERATHRYARTMLEAMATAKPEPDASDEQDVRRFIEGSQLDPVNGTAVLDSIFDLGETRAIELMPPTTTTLNAAYPACLADELERQVSKTLEFARNAFEEPSSSVLEALERYIEQGSTDPRLALDAARRVTRLQLLCSRLRDTLRTCDRDATEAAHRAAQAAAAMQVAVQTIRGEIDSAGFFTRKARLLAAVQPAFTTVTGHARQRVRYQLERERCELHRTALLMAITHLEVVLTAALETPRTSAALDSVVKEALRLYRIQLQAAEHTDLRTGLTDFEVQVGLPCEVPDEEVERASRDAQALCRELMELDGEVGARQLLDAVLDHAGTYARKVYHDDVNILEIIEQHEAAGPPDSGLLGDSYSGWLVKRLGQLGQPLWHFDSGALYQDRAEGYTKVTICGAPGATRAKVILHRHYAGASHQPSFVGTGDRHRITMINFVSALPIAALSEIEYYEQRYNKLFVPPVHSTRFFQMNAETLIPGSRRESLMFSLLSVGIVDGLDLISDEKHHKGDPGRYRLLFDLEADPDHPLRSRRPKLGDKFIDAHAYLLHHPFVARQLLNLTVERLEELRSQDPEKLKALIDAQVTKLEDEVLRRKMNKIITWRYMRRELELLRRAQLWEEPFEDLFGT